jgi:hypothetical protein
MFPDHPQKPSLTQHECRQGPQSTGRCNGGDDRDRAGSTHRITSKSAASVPPRPIIRNYTMWEPGPARLGGGRWYKSPARRSRGCRGRPPRPPRRRRRNFAPRAHGIMVNVCLRCTGREDATTWPLTSGVTDASQDVPADVLPLWQISMLGSHKP